VKLPIWLYHERNHDGIWRVRRYGSRRPLRVVLTVIDGDDDMSTCVMGAVGRLGVQVGPEDGVSEGFTSMPKGSRCKLFSLHNGIGLGLTWEASHG
jgi:hypothetical protein